MNVTIKKTKVREYATGIRRLWGHDCALDRPAKQIPIYVVLVDGQRVDSFMKYRNARAKARFLRDKQHPVGEEWDP